MSKPIDTGKQMNAEHLKGGDGHIYYAGIKPFMKRKQSRKRRRQDKQEATP